MQDRNQDPTSPLPHDAGRVAPKDYLDDPERYLTPLQRSWLQPSGSVHRSLRRGLFLFNRALMHTVFRLEVVGREHVPLQSAFILTPNHTSSLDGPAIAAALDYRVLARTRWAGRRGAVLRNPCRRWLNRLAQTVPIDPDTSALAVAAAILRREQNLVWFPEGSRSEDGKLQPFRAGIGLLLYHLRVPAVPVCIDGAFEALPPDHNLPRLGKRIAVRFGEPWDPGELIDAADDESAAVEMLVDTLRQRVAALSVCRTDDPAA